MTLADVDTWFALARRIEEHDASNERTGRAEMVEQFENTALDPTLDSIIGIDDDGVPRAYGWVETNPAARTHHQAMLSGGVDPEWRRLGIGQTVLDWQIMRARAALAAVAVDSALPRRLVAHAEEHQTDRFALLERARFTPERWFMQMRCSLSDEPAQPRPIFGIAIVPLRTGLSEALRQAHNEVFADHWGSQPITEQRWAQYAAKETLRPEWSFLALDTAVPAEREPPIVGYAIGAAHEQDWAPQGYTEGWTDVLGVVNSHRGRGIAEALLLSSMRAFREAGLQYAGLDVDTENPTGAYGLYARLGYEPQHRGAAFVLPV